MKYCNSCGDLEKNKIKCIICNSWTCDECSVSRCNKCKLKLCKCKNSMMLVKCPVCDKGKQEYEINKKIII